MARDKYELDDEVSLTSQAYGKCACMYVCVQQPLMPSYAQSRG